LTRMPVALRSCAQFRARLRTPASLAL
jgi:hypothetical protein